MLSISDVNVLGQVMNSTWGASSADDLDDSAPYGYLPPTISLKGMLISDSKLKIVYTTYQTVASDRILSQQMPVFEDEGKQWSNKYLANIKTEFREHSGRTLKTKLESAKPSVEIVSLQSHVSPARTIAFRYTVILSVE